MPRARTAIVMNEGTVIRAVHRVEVLAPIIRSAQKSKTHIFEVDALIQEQLPVGFPPVSSEKQSVTKPVFINSKRILYFYEL